MLSRTGFIAVVASLLISSTSSTAEPNNDSMLQGIWHVESDLQQNGSRLTSFRRADLIFLRGRIIVVPTDDGAVSFAPGYFGQDATVYRYQLGAENPHREFDLIKKDEGK